MADPSELPVVFDAPWATIWCAPDRADLAGPRYLLEYRGPARVGTLREELSRRQMEFATEGPRQAYGVLLYARAMYQNTDPFAPLGSLEWYRHLRVGILLAGYTDDIPWSETLEPIHDADAFWREYAHVVLNSGMKNVVAEGIWKKVRPAVESGGSAGSVFNHKGKAAAIDRMYARRHEALAEYLAVPASDRELQVAHLVGLPWIGPITVYHLAKNFGADVAKPDRHLERVAGKGFQAVQAFCEKLSRESGDRIATVDLVIWRAAAIGQIDTRSMIAKPDNL